jgi:hypothetical protein
MPQHRAIALAVLVLAATSGRGHAAESDTETRLREALRASITQVRSLEDERAALLARQAEADKRLDALRQEVEALNRQLAERPQGARTPERPARDDRIVALNAQYEQAVAEFNRRLVAQNDAIAKQGETLEKWKAAYNEAAGLARSREAERAKLAEQVTGLDQRAGACVAKNLELFNVASDILGRYAAMDLGDVLAAREPFIGLKRVELQNLVQDYQDKLLDQKVSTP